MMMMIVTTFGRRSSERKSRWKTIKENQRSLLSDRMAAHDVVFGVLRDERVVPVAGVVAVAVATEALVRVGRDGVETARIDDVAVVEVCGRLFALSSVPGLVFQGMAYAVEEEAAAAGVRVRVRVRGGEGRSRVAGWGPWGGASGGWRGGGVAVGVGGAPPVAAPTHVCWW